MSYFKGFRKILRARRKNGESPFFLGGGVGSPHLSFSQGRGEEQSQKNTKRGEDSGRKNALKEGLDRRRSRRKRISRPLLVIRGFRNTAKQEEEVMIKKGEKIHHWILPRGNHGRLKKKLNEKEKGKELERGKEGLYREVLKVPQS